MSQVCYNYHTASKASLNQTIAETHGCLSAAIEYILIQKSSTRTLLLLLLNINIARSWIGRTTHNKHKTSWARKQTSVTVNELYLSSTLSK